MPRSIVYVVCVALITARHIGCDVGAIDEPTAVDMSAQSSTSEVQSQPSPDVHAFASSDCVTNVMPNILKFKPLFAPAIYEVLKDPMVDQRIVDWLRRDERYQYYALKEIIELGHGDNPAVQYFMLAISIQLLYKSEAEAALATLVDLTLEDEQDLLIVQEMQQHTRCFFQNVGQIDVPPLAPVKADWQSVSGIEMYTWTPSTRIEELRQKWKRIQHDAVNFTVARYWGTHTGAIEGLYAITPNDTTDFVLGRVPLRNVLHEQRLDIVMHDFEVMPMVELLVYSQIAVAYRMMRGAHAQHVQQPFVKSLHRDLSHHQHWAEYFDTKLNKKTYVALEAGAYKLVPHTAGEHRHCPPSEVGNEMEKLITLLNQYMDEGMDPIVLSSWLHTELISIRPFLHGNARTARALLSYVLVRSGLPPFTPTLDTKHDYDEAVLQARSTKNLTHLVNFMQDALAETIAFLALSGDSSAMTVQPVTP